MSRWRLFGQLVKISRADYFRRDFSKMFDKFMRDIAARQHLPLFPTEAEHIVEETLMKSFSNISRGLNSITYCKNRLPLAHQYKIGLDCLVENFAASTSFSTVLKRDLVASEGARSMERYIEVNTDIQELMESSGEKLIHPSPQLLELMKISSFSTHINQDLLYYEKCTLRDFLEEIIRKRRSPLFSASERDVAEENFENSIPFIKKVILHEFALYTKPEDRTKAQRWRSALQFLVDEFIDNDYFHDRLTQDLIESDEMKSLEEFIQGTRNSRPVHEDIEPPPFNLPLTHVWCTDALRPNALRFDDSPFDNYQCEQKEEDDVLDYLDSDERNGDRKKVQAQL